jgi:NADH dehydrogenase [ubiquinone] 1 alpha subcomplex assembly factor 7
VTPAPVTPAPVTSLELLLRRQIAAHGPLPLADYMTEALLHPEHGYYRGGDPLGRAGDFVTAPEISQVFGELIGAWCAEMWRAVGAPDRAVLAELGPGRGTLLADLWRTASHLAPAFAQALRLHLVEASPSLRAAQQERLHALTPRPAAFWHERVEDLWRALPPEPLLLIANEFFDALPIRQYVRRSGRWCERLVTQAPEGEGFVFVDGAALEHVPSPLGDPAIEPAEGEVLELCAAADDLAAAIAARLTDCGGAALIIDYGPARSGFGDTLQAVCGHRKVEPLRDPGLADLSHHVDFARLGRIARDTGAAVWGPVPQGLFLGRLGAAARADALAAAAPTPERGDALTGAVRRLLHPGRMGLLFKVLAIAHPALPPPPGFSPDPAAGIPARAP